PPIAENVTLSSSYPYAGGYLYISYDYYDDNSDPESFTVFRWYRNDVLQSYGVQNLTTAQLIKGDVWYAEVRPRDGKDNGNWVSSDSITILNTPPVVISAEIFPSSDVYTDESLLAEGYYEWSDIDGDLVNISIVWINGSQEVAKFNNKTQVPSSDTKKGEVWKYKIKVFDGTNWSSYFNSSEVTILNKQMVIDSIILSGGANTTEDISLNYTYSDIDGDEISLAQTKINWTIELENGTNIYVNGGETLSHTYFFAASKITVEITPHDGEQLGTSRVSEDLTIENAAPYLIGKPNILGPDNSTDFYASGKLSVNYTAADPDTGEGRLIYEIEYDLDGYVDGATYRWYRNDILVPELTIESVPISYLVKGDTWKVSVSPRDSSFDFGAWVESDIIVIINSPPVITEFFEVNPLTRSDEDLDLEFIYSDYDEDPINLSETLISWYKDGALISGTGNTVVYSEQIGNDFKVTVRLNSDYYIRGENITVEIQPHDNFELALQSNTSFVVTIGNARPRASDVKLQPNGTDRLAYTIDNLNVSWSYFDPDGDIENKSMVRIIWINTVTPQPQLENQISILSGNTKSGEIWTVQIYVFDGIEWSLVPKPSSPLLIQNTAPVIVSVTIKSDSGEFSETYADTNLIVDPTGENPTELNYTDVDGHIINPLGTLIRWYRNGTHIPLYDGNSTLPSSAMTKGDIWFVEIQVTDDLVIYSQNQSSQSITIINKAPIVASVLLLDAEHPGSGFLV
ncbi:MAG: hypothetical protein ACW99Q_26370, partial [Candidatus Kariarchaeaceae archaeon]